MVEVEVGEGDLDPLLSSTLEVVATVTPGRIRVRIGRRRESAVLHCVAVHGQVAAGRCKLETIKLLLTHLHATVRKYAYRDQIIRSVISFLNIKLPG